MTTDAEGPPVVPLAGLLGALLRHIERGVITAVHEAGFIDVRDAHNAVFAFVPASGIRLTDLAERAGISKQAMGELVTDLVAKGYFSKEPDPADGRAKLICWAERGWRANEVVQGYFVTMEAELAAAVGGEAMRTTRSTLEALVMGGHVDR